MTVSFDELEPTTEHEEQENEAASHEARGENFDDIIDVVEVISGMVETYARADAGTPAVDSAAVGAQVQHGPLTQEQSKQRERDLVQRHRDRYTRLQGRLARATQLEEGFLAGRVPRGDLERFIGEIDRLADELSTLETEHGAFALQVRAAVARARSIVHRLRDVLAKQPPVPSTRGRANHAVERSVRVKPKVNVSFPDGLAEKQRIDREHPGRRLGGSEVVMRPRAKAGRDDRSDPLAEDTVRGELYQAAHHARQAKYIVATTGHDVAAATAAARAGCDAAAYHLSGVALAIRHVKVKKKMDLPKATAEAEARARVIENASAAFADAWATCSLLLDAIVELDPEATAAPALRTALDGVPKPRGWKPPSKQSQQRIALLQKDHEDRDRTFAIAGPLAQASRVLDAAVDFYRGFVAASQKPPEFDATKKPAHFAAAAAAAQPYLQRAATTLASSTPADRAQARAAAERSLTTAQRYVSWALSGDPHAREAAEMMRDESAPIAQWAGLPSIVMTGGAGPGDNDVAIDSLEKLLVEKWRMAFTARVQAANELVTTPEPAVEASWDERALAFVLQLGLTTLAGALAGAAGAAVATSASSEIVKGLLANGTESFVTAAIEQALKEPPRTRPRTLEQVRRAFFGAQTHALNDTVVGKRIELRELAVEMKTRRDGVAILGAVSTAFEAKSAEIAALHKAHLVQEWATYRAGTAHGKDAAGGVNMTGVGRGVDEKQLEKTDVELPTGVLEIDVDLSAGQPRIARALAGGLRADDAAALANARIGDLRMPAQFRIYAMYTGRRGVPNSFRDRTNLQDLPLEDYTHPASFVVSRNETGALWLRDVGPVGRAYVTQKYGGDPDSDEDVLRGLAEIIALLADHKLAGVEAT